MLYKIGSASTYSGALNELEALQYQYALFSQQKNRKLNAAFFINGDPKDSESAVFFKYAKNKYDAVFYILTDIRLVNDEILNIINNERQYKILTSFMNLDKYFNVDASKIILCEIEVATAYTLYLLKKADIQTLKNAKIDNIEFTMPLYIGSIRNKRYFQIFEFIRHYKDKLDNNIKLRILSKTDFEAVKQYFNENYEAINTNPAKYRYSNGNVIVNHLSCKIEFDDLNHFIDYTNTDIADFVEYLTLIKKHNCLFFTDIEYLMFNYLQLRVFEALLVNKLYFIPHYLMNIEYVDDNSNTHFVMSEEHFKKILKRYNLHKVYEQLLNVDITEVDFKSKEFFEMLYANDFDFEEYCQAYYKDKLNIFEYAVREY